MLRWSLKPRNGVSSAVAKIPFMLQQLELRPLLSWAVVVYSYCQDLSCFYRGQSIQWNKHRYDRNSQQDSDFKNPTGLLPPPRPNRMQCSFCFSIWSWVGDFQRPALGLAHYNNYYPTGSRPGMGVHYLACSLYFSYMPGDRGDSS